MTGMQNFAFRFEYRAGHLKWSAGTLLGVTSASPRETIRWPLEYEITSDPTRLIGPHWQTRW
jgi:hypothetical protein